jgi:hypothetical protein
MLNEMHIPVSSSIQDEYSNNVAFNKIFLNQMEQMNDLEDINMDNLYFIKDKRQKNTITFEDFEQFYKKLTEIEEINEIEIANYEKPTFNINLNQEKIFSTFENEKYVNVVNPENKIKYKCINEEKIEYNNIKENESIKIDEQLNKEIIEEAKEILINNNDQEINKCENIDNNNNNFEYMKLKNNKKKKQEELFYPFTPGKGIQQCLKIYEESSISSNNNKEQSKDNSNNIGDNKSQNKNKNNRENFENSQNSTEKNSGENEEDSIYTEQIVNGKENILFKFTTKKYFINMEGKKRRIKKKRKFKSDDIRKKIKSRFHKTFKNIINENLKKAGAKKLFDFFPQCFIGNISKKINGECLELTYKELILKDFVSENNKEKEQNVDYKKYIRNKEVLEYLEKNEEICKKSGFDIIKNKKYKDLLNIYFSSGEFEDSIIRLKKENESKEYIQEYVLKAKNYVNFYSKYKNNNEDEENSEE